MLRSLNLPLLLSGVRTLPKAATRIQPRSSAAFARGFQSRASLVKSESNTPQTPPNVDPAKQSIFAKLKSFLSAYGSKIVTAIAVGGVTLENLVQLGTIPDESQITLYNHYLINLQNSVIVSGLNSITEAIAMSPFAARSFGTSGILTQVIAHLDSKVEYVTYAAVGAVKALSINNENIQDMREYGAIGVLIDLSLKTGDNEVLEALASVCNPIEYDSDFNTSVLSYGDILAVVPLLSKTENPLELHSILKITAAASLQYTHLSPAQKASLLATKERLEHLTKSEDEVLSGFATLILDMITNETDTKTGINSYRDITSASEYFESLTKTLVAGGIGVVWGLTRAIMTRGPILVSILKSCIGSAVIVSLDQTITQNAFEKSRSSKDSNDQINIIASKFVAQSFVYVVVMSLCPYSLVPSMIPNHKSIATTVHGTLNQAVDL